MGKMQRTKGKVFERKIATAIRERYPGAIVRRANQTQQAYESDVFVDGDCPEILHRLWLECNDAIAPNPLKKLEQAERDIAAASEDIRGRTHLRRLPLVVWHKKGARTINVTTRLKHLMEATGVAWDDLHPLGGEVLVTVDFDDFMDKVI